MNINMIDASEKSKVIMDKTKYGYQSTDNARMAEMMAGYSLDITGKVMENAAYEKEDLLSAEDIKTEASLIDVPNQRNYMAVMSNSISEDDFSELLKDGYNPTHLEVKESVTSLDKMKAKMAENGQVIEGFNDDLSSEDIKEALNLGTAIMPLSDDSMAYLIKNEQEPTLSNLYKAEHSSILETYSKYGVAVDKTEAAWDDIKAQAERIIKEAGFNVNEITLNNAKWLVENQIPLNEMNLKAYDDLCSISLPASKDTILSSISVALQEGKSPEDGNLLETESIYNRAASIIEEFAQADDRGDIARRRQLEEIRLSMTVEANMTLLRKGITIDTENLENLVDELKKAEEEFYRPLLGNNEGKRYISKESDFEDGISIREKIELFKETSNVISSLKEAPIQSVGYLIETKADFNLRNLNATSEYLTSEYAKAGKSYETMMTAPRSDMGDSITKAFRNVDDILSDLKLPVSDDNRRAVRIMGYSEIQMNRENVEEIRTAANAVTSVIEMMNPAKTLQMIREGHNPLTENIYELEKSLKEETIEESSEKYSEFLLKLERRGEITEDEKSAFIGMYRLFDKIERRDSRVIGKVLAAGEELNFKNLLSAYRSGKFSKFDVSVDNEFGALETLIVKGDTITDQIEKGFKTVMQEETPREYIQDKLSDITASEKETEAIELLEKMEMPVNIENIMAASDFSKKGKSPFKKITEEDDSQESVEAKSNIRKKAKELINDFTNAENIREAYENFTEDVKHEAEKMMTNAETYIDVKEWARLNRQIELAGNMARADEYEVPVETEDGYISIHLKLRQTGNGEGRVDASFTTEKYGEINARFTVNDEKISGIISSKYDGGFDIIRNKEVELRSAFESEGFSTDNISYVKADGIRETELSQGNATNRQLFKVAGVFLKTMEKE